jgi:hypothetical protein
MEAGTVYHAKWAFIKDANAVVIDVVINFLSAEEYAAAVVSTPSTAPTSSRVRLMTCRDVACRPSTKGVSTSSLARR